MRSLILQALPADPQLLLFLLLFVAIFCGIVFWQWRPERRAEQDRLAQLPLSDSD
jgi:cbb3-type cytochrome oxidase subunit 3